MIYEDMTPQYIADLIGVPVERVEPVIGQINEHLRKLYGADRWPARARLALVPLGWEPAEPTGGAHRPPQLRIVRGGQSR